MDAVENPGNPERIRELLVNTLMVGRLPQARFGFRNLLAKPLRREEESMQGLLPFGDPTALAGQPSSREGILEWKPCRRSSTGEG